jgi:hypothetical protein
LEVYPTTYLASLILFHIILLNLQFTWAYLDFLKNGYKKSIRDIKLSEVNSCRILSEKLIITQIVKKYPSFFMEPVHYRVHNIPPLDPILSHPNPVRRIVPYFPKVHLNVILPPTPRSSQWSLLFGPYSLTHLLTYLLTYLLHGADYYLRADCHVTYQEISCFLFGTRKLVTVFTKARHWTLSWASWIQIAPSIPISLKSMLILSSHVRLGLPTGYLRASQPKPCKHLFPAICVPHVPPTSTSLI